jgi:hypothetical protein
MTTPNLKLPKWAAFQEQPWVPENGAKGLIDALLPKIVVSDALATPPAAPAAGACYIVAASATGAWAGWEGKIAAYIDGVWVQLAPQEGWVFWVVSNGGRSVYKSGTWVALIEDAPKDGGAYARKNGMWQDIRLLGGMYDREVKFAGSPLASGVIYSRVLGRNLDFPADFGGSIGSVGTHPSAAATLDVLADGISIGAITISVGGLFSFSTVGGSAKRIVAGSVLTIIAPPIVDATLADIEMTILATSDGGSSAIWVPQNLFSGAENGVILEVDKSTLWQDVAGTIPVAADGDPVALWQDKSGNGTDLMQSDTALRPVYRAGGGKPYIQFSSTSWMYWSIGALNFADLSVHITTQTFDAAKSVIVAPHFVNSSASPYFRWAFWMDSAYNFGNRVNGNVVWFNSPGTNIAPTNIGMDTVAGSHYKNGMATSAFPAQTLTYPNAVAPRISANGAGLLGMPQNVYGVVAVNRGLTAVEIGKLNIWMQGLI